VKLGPEDVTKHSLCLPADKEIKRFFQLPLLFLPAFKERED
jgi:hypothetical protein